jgi:hypothetical protein
MAIEPGLKHPRLEGQYGKSNHAAEFSAIECEAKDAAFSYSCNTVPVVSGQQGFLASVAMAQISN